jgi:hypothetical protein
LAYANAWPNALVVDDKLFVDYQSFSDYSAIPRYFSEDAWAERNLSGGLRRPPYAYRSSQFDFQPVNHVSGPGRDGRFMVVDALPGIEAVAGRRTDSALPFFIDTSILGPERRLGE